MRFLLIVIFCLVFFVFGCNSHDIEEEVEEELSVVVITEENIAMHEREIARDKADENLSSEEIREQAMEKAIRREVANSIFKEKGITVSEEELEEELSLVILEKEGVETKEEFFDKMATLGFSEKEIVRDLKNDIKIEKALLLIIKDIEVTEEEAKSYYLYRKEKLEKEGVKLRPLEEIEDTIVKDVTHIFALEELLEKFEKKREEAEIILE